MYGMPKKNLEREQPIKVEDLIHAIVIMILTWLESCCHSFFGIGRDIRIIVSIPISNILTISHMKL